MKVEIPDLQFFAIISVGATLFSNNSTIFVRWRIHVFSNGA